MATVLVPVALAGGQGKTTTALSLGRYLSRRGIPTLTIDCDPQASLTNCLGVEVGATQATTLEVLSKKEREVPLVETIVSVDNEENLFVIPSTQELQGAESILAASGESLFVLKDRLADDERVGEEFQVIIVDPPPQQGHLALTAIGSANVLVSPAEASTKGVQSLSTTLALLKRYQRRLRDATFMGVIPFRAKWVGCYPTTMTRASIDAMGEISEEGTILPHFLESEIWKRAIDMQCLPSDLDKPDLEHPLDEIVRVCMPGLLSKTELVAS